MDTENKEVNVQEITVWFYVSFLLHKNLEQGKTAFNLQYIERFDLITWNFSFYRPIFPLSK